ncbi:MAG: hypothetical protein U0Q16_04940 [Bryobacteraceae bacterium]
MIRFTRRRLLGAATFLIPASLEAQRRRRVVVTNRRTTVVVRPGHPIARAVNRTVIVRAPHRAIVVGAPLVFLPVVAFVAVAAVLPPRERLIWQDTETIHRDEDWVESNFGIDARGDALYLDIAGRAQLDFADIVFENGEVQVVDFNEHTYGNGIHRLLDFPGRRNVKTVRLVARSKSEDTAFRIYLSA